MRREGRAASRRALAAPGPTLTIGRGAPVSLYTVSRELGHGSEEMVRRVYSHLGTVRHRSEVVEFRAEQHYERLGISSFGWGLT